MPPGDTSSDWQLSADMLNAECMVLSKKTKGRRWGISVIRICGCGSSLSQTSHMYPRADTWSFTVNVCVCEQWPGHFSHFDEQPSSQCPTQSLLSKLTRTPTERGRSNERHEGFACCPIRIMCERVCVCALVPWRLVPCTRSALLSCLYFALQTVASYSR